MNTRCMGKGIGANHSFIRLHHKACDLRNQLRGWHDLFGIDAHIQLKEILTSSHRHHNFFQGSIARALAQTINRALHLTGTANVHTG